MLSKKFIVLILALFFYSCGNNNVRDYRDIYNNLKKDNLYAKFIGLHIVRRDGGDQFWYNNLKDNNSWQVISYDFISKIIDKDTRLFFEKNSNAKTIFDTMIKYDIKAVITDNYNAKTKRLEYQDEGRYDFHKYKLIFIISDSISIANINFDYKDYMQIISEYHYVIKGLDPNWFVLKRL